MKCSRVDSYLCDMYLYDIYLEDIKLVETGPNFSVL